MERVKLAGWIWSLYINGAFLEYFASSEEALEFAKNFYPNLDILIRPISYFTFKEKRKN